jgi:LPS-assembly protein
LPTFSADSGLYLERNIEIANTSLVHTLEPRLFYLYVPYTNQNTYTNNDTPNSTATNLLNPVFDTGLYDFQYNSMFRENSFSGYDRLQDANQITTALTSRLMDDKSGLERLKLNVGEIIYFRNRLVSVPTTLTNGTIENIGSSTAAVSNLVTELSSELSHQISVTTGLQYNPVLNDVERTKAALHFRNESNQVFNIGYLYRKNPLIPDGSNNITQADASFRVPIAKDWHLLGKWQYSLLYDTTQDSFLGVEKENCCWRIRILGRHYMNNYSNVTNVGVNSTQTVTGATQNGIFFQIELKGLTGFGDDMDQFLQKSIYGFRASQK